MPGTTDQWSADDLVAARLREELPDEYYVASEPTLAHNVLDAMVVGPQGIFVLHLRDWEGEVHPAQRGQWLERPGDGRELHHPNPAQEAKSVRQALGVFLRDEFPSLNPLIYHLVVLTSPGARVVGSGDPDLPVLSIDGAVQAIMSTALPTDKRPLDPETLELLSTALCERGLTASQQAAEPFVFRSGGLFGSGKKVRTIRAMVRHMDRHPEDGLFHLRNGTLAKWLSEQGSEHLSRLARDVMQSGDSDARVPLERFLIGTGLVARPRLLTRPRRVNLGYALAGQQRSCRLRIRQGRGRGYLYGTLRKHDAWLTIEPTRFSGGSSVCLVKADTETLPIARMPSRSEILIESSASEEPIAVPVRVRVVAMPSSINQRLLRPLVGLLAAVLLGGALGWAMGRWGVAAPSGLAGLTVPAMSSAGTWMLLIGLFWALLGWLRGRSQPAEWPVAYAAGRWALITAVWALAIGCVTAAGYWAWNRFFPATGPADSGVTGMSVFLLSLAVSILPAVQWERRRAQGLEASSDLLRPRALLRPLLWAIVGVALVVLVATGGPLLGPVWQQVGSPQPQKLATELWDRLGTGVNNIIDRLYIRYYDRRAPVPPTPTVHPEETPAP